MLPPATALVPLDDDELELFLVLLHAATRAGAAASPATPAKPLSAVRRLNCVVTSGRPDVGADPESDIGASIGWVKRVPT
jgi:hypothetical protein